MPSVDVLIPCYRYGHFLRECVSSVLTQEDVDVRVLIVDDASNDDSPEVAKKLASEDRRVEVIVHRANRGHVATYNEGIEWASAKYFLLLSADDLITPGCFRRAVSIMEQHPSISMTHGGEINLFPDQGAPVLPQQSFDGQWLVRPGIELINELCNSTINRIRTSTVVVRTETQKAVGGYRSELPHSGDMEMWLRLATVGDVAETALIQGIRRIHATNMSKLQYGRPIDDFQQLVAAFDSFFENEGQTLENFKDLWALTRVRLARRYLRQGMSELGRKGATGSISRRGLELVAAALRVRTKSIALRKLG